MAFVFIISIPKSIKILLFTPEILYGSMMQQTDKNSVNVVFANAKAPVVPKSFHSNTKVSKIIILCVSRLIRCCFFNIILQECLFLSVGWNMEFYTL